MTANRVAILRTERLLVRAATQEDVDLYHALWTDPRVMGFVGFPQGLPISRSEILDRLAQQHQSELGQLLVAELLLSREPIGECHMGEPDNEGIAEPDVKLLPVYWGHGYVAELWRALVTHLFEHTRCVAIHGTPNIHNVASIRMQESAGAVRVGEGTCFFPEAMNGYTVPVPHYVYRLSREDWLRVNRSSPAGTH